MRGSCSTRVATLSSLVQCVLFEARGSHALTTARASAMGWFREASGAVQRTPSAALESKRLDQLASAVSRNALVVTRDVEWGQVLLGFEQAQQYSVRDQDGQVVALLAEEHGGMGTMVTRQLLRSRRGFKATVLSPDGSEVLFKMRRPAYLVSSTMYIEDADDQRIGEVQQEWHLLKRCYNLFVGRDQYARIEAPFLAWDFVLRDGHGSPLALIDRNFSGFGKELFTDAGRYAIHFGDTPEASARFVQRSLEAAHPEKGEALRAPVASFGPDTKAVIPCSTGDQLVLSNPLDLDERLVALAAAISIDYDYFSRHSYGSGLLSPFIGVPIPMPLPPAPPVSMPDVSSGGDAGPGSGAGAGAAGDADTEYDWEGFRGGGETGAQEEPGDTGDGGDWDEWDDFGVSETQSEGASSGLFDLLREWTEE